MKYLIYFVLVITFNGCKTIQLNDSILFYPVNIADYTSYAYFQEINIKDSSGNIINGIELNHHNRKKVVLYFHGNGGSIWVKRFEKIVKIIDTLNYNMLAIDYTGYGKSTGIASINHLYSNANAIYEYAINKYSADSIFIWGYSIGSIPSCRLASEGKGNKIIIESGLTYSDEVVMNVVKNNTNGFQRMFIRIQMDETLKFSPQEDIKKSKQPFLFIHGDMDEMIPIEQALVNYQSVSNANKKIYTVKNVGHNDTDEYRDEYFNILNSFLSQ